MASDRTAEREEERRFNIRTLIIASVASFLAAVITSQFTKSGTPIAAAVTPVVVTLISELLHKPTEVVARRITGEGAALSAPPPPPTEALPDEAPEVPASAAEPPVPPSSKESRADEPDPTGPVNVYRRQAPKRKIAIGVVAAISLIAFAIAAVAFTGTELATGGDLGGRDRKTTFFGGKKSDKEEPAQDEDAQPQEDEQQPEERPEPAPSQEQQPKQQTETQTEETTTQPGGAQQRQQQPGEKRQPTR